MKNRIRGKNTERALAKILGGRRVGILGKEDIDIPGFCVEIKDRVKFIGDNFLKQAEKHLTDYKKAIAIVHIHKQPHEKDIVLMRLKDWMEMELK